MARKERRERGAWGLYSPLVSCDLPNHRLKELRFFEKGTLMNSKFRLVTMHDLAALVQLKHSEPTFHSDLPLRKSPDRDTECVNCLLGCMRLSIP
jgi:hypothetical protein